VSELVFLDIARETEMPTDPGHGNSAEIHFLPTTSEFLFNSATTATGAAHGGNEGLVATFIRWCDLVRERSPRTLESYYYVLGHLVRWLGPRSVTGVSRRDLELFVLRPRPRGGTPSSATKRREIAVLRSFYGWMWEEGYTAQHLARGLHGPKAKGRDPKPIPDDVWKQMWLKDWPAEVRVILGLGYFGGLRRAEIWNLTVAQLGVDRLDNFERKGGGSHGLPLGVILDIYERSELLQPLLVDRRLLTDAIIELQTRCDGSDWVAPYKKTARDPEALNKRLTTWCHQAGVERFTPHQCRHSAATNLARAGLPPHLIMEVLNHSSLDVTMRYVRTSGSVLQEWLDTAS
jgi:integrase